MQNALAYLFFTKFKNRIKDLFKKPARLIYVVIILVLIGFTIYGGNAGDGNTHRVLRDIHELGAVITVLYSFIFVMIVKNGFNNGASMFSMSDVNLIFTAPIPSSRVLFYGLFQQLGTSLLLGLFILFQYSIVHSSYGLGYAGLLLILLGYTITVFFAQLISMVIYSFTSASEKKRKVAKILYYGIIGAFVAYALLYIAADRSQALTRAVEAANSTVIKLFPVSGWLGGAVTGIFTASAVDVLLGFGLCVLLLILLVVLILVSNPDYYEDVIKSAEISQSAITAKKEGIVGEVAPQNVKVGKTGIGKGWGANTFFYKHLLENRRSGLLFIGRLNLIFTFSTIVFSFFMREVGVSAVFAFSIYMQIFVMALGRFNKELTKPFIYLIPQPPFKKLVFALAESLPTISIQAVLIFVPVSFIIHMNPLDTVFCIAAYVSFSFIFTAANVAVERILGGSMSKVFVMLFYFVLAIVMAAPGIILAIILGAMGIGSENLVIFASLTICNIPVSLLVLFLCRNMLQYAELNHQ